MKKHELEGGHDSSQSGAETAGGGVGVASAPQPPPTTTAAAAAAAAANPEFFRQIRRQFDALSRDVEIDDDDVDVGDELSDAAPTALGRRHLATGVAS